MSFGPSRTVNPLDILVPFDFMMINLEQRTGVDALRFNYTLGDMSELDTGVVIDKELIDSSQFKFLTFSNSFEEWNYKLYLMSLYEHLIKGLSLEGAISNWGVWLEYGQFRLENAKTFERYSIGTQYYFLNDLNFFVEYHFNGAETSIEKKYDKNYMKDFQQQLAIFLKGKQYLNFGISYPIASIHAIGLTWFNNLNDSSSLLSPSFEYNFSQDWYLSIGSFVGFDNKKKSKLNSKSNSKLQSEFGVYPRAFFATLKKFF